MCICNKYDINAHLKNIIVQHTYTHAHVYTLLYTRTHQLGQDKSGPGLRGMELLVWGQYIAEGGHGVCFMCFCFVFGGPTFDSFFIYWANI